jgi:hypothetical protein
MSIWNYKSFNDEELDYEDCISEIFTLVNVERPTDDSKMRDMLDRFARDENIKLKVSQLILLVGDIVTVVALFKNENCPKETLAIPFVDDKYNHFASIVLKNPNCPAIYKVMI